jgi:ribosome-associated protein
VTATDTARDLSLAPAQAAADKGATDIIVIDVSDRLPLTDCFIVATGSNERQVGAIVDAVSEKLAKIGVKAVRREGERDGRWVLLDFGDVVVHVQHAEERVFYALDRLWSDCPTIPFVDSALPAAAENAAAANGQ